MTVRLAFSPDPAYVRTARLVAAAVARRAGVTDELLGEVRLAVGEACARAVALHRRHGVVAAIDVFMSDGGRFTVSVIDRSPVGLAATAVGALRPGAHPASGEFTAALADTALNGRAARGAVVAKGGRRRTSAHQGTRALRPAAVGIADAPTSDELAGGEPPNGGSANGEAAARHTSTADGVAYQRPGDGIPASEPGAAGLVLDEDELTAGVGLALLTGMVSDLAVSPLADGPGTQVRMSWPVARRSAS